MAEWVRDHCRAEVVFVITKASDRVACGMCFADIRCVTDGSRSARGPDARRYRNQSSIRAFVEANAV
jgi:hypothetical protein